MEEPEPLFMIHILDGYSFRNLMGIIKHEINQASMILSEKSIEISFISSNGHSGHNILLFPYDCAKWSYNLRDEYGELYEEFPIAFDTTQFFNTTKSIGKRDGIRIYLLPGDDKLSVQLLKVSTKNPGSAEIFMIKILNIEHSRYTPPVYTTEPNIRVLAKDFTEMCGCVIDQRCETLDAEADNNAIIFKGIQANRNVAYIKRYEGQNNQCSQQESVQLASNINDISNMLRNMSTDEKKPTNRPKLRLNVVSNNNVSVKIPIVTIKSISKIHNISNNNTLLKFYVEKGKPLKISSSISGYGLYEITLV